MHSESGYERPLYLKVLLRLDPEIFDCWDENDFHPTRGQRPPLLRIGDAPTGPQERPLEDVAIRAARVIEKLR